MGWWYIIGGSDSLVLLPGQPACMCSFIIGPHDFSLIVQSSVYFHLSEIEINVEDSKTNCENETNM